MKQLLRTTIRLLWAIFLFALGVLLLFLPTHPDWLEKSVTYIQNSPSWVYLLGLILLILGSTLFVRLVTNRKNRSLSFRSSRYTIEVEEKIILEQFNRALKPLPLGAAIKTRVELRRGIIHLFATLPNENNQVDLIQSIEMEVSKTLFELLGYNNELNLELSFAK